MLERRGAHQLWGRGGAQGRARMEGLWPRLGPGGDEARAPGAALIVRKARCEQGVRGCPRHMGLGSRRVNCRELGERQRPGGRRPGGSALTTSTRGSTVAMGPRRQTDGEGSQAGSMPDTASREQEASAQSSWERCRPPGNPDLTALEPSRTPGYAWKPRRAQLPGRSPAKDGGWGRPGPRLPRVPPT